MARAVVAVIIGYVVMSVMVMASFSIAYLAMGTERAFKPGSYDVTALWLIVSFALGLIAAVVGGFVCAAIAKRSQAPPVLAGIVLALGLLLAVPAKSDLGDDQPQTRDGSVGNFEAMQHAEQPLWVALANPFLGAAGVLIGSRLNKNKPTG